MKKYILIILSLSLLLLTACQSKQADESAGTTDVPNGVPFSKGPTEAPSVKGPTAPPPVAADQVEAVTTKENIKLTLPAISQ